MAAEVKSTTVQSMEEISVVHDVEYKTIPGFAEGQQIRIGSLTAGDLIEWSEANEGEAKRTAGIRLIVKSLADDAGVRYAMKDEAKNIQILKARAHKTTEKIVKAVLELNGMNVKAEDETKKG